MRRHGEQEQDADGRVGDLQVGRVAETIARTVAADRHDGEGEEGGHERRYGARRKTRRSARSGSRSSLKNSLMPSASVWSRPHGPARLGPMRFCMSEMTLRSNQTMRSTATIRNAKPISDFTQTIRTTPMSMPSDEEGIAGGEQVGEHQRLSIPISATGLCTASSAPVSMPGTLKGTPTVPRGWKGSATASMASIVSALLRDPDGAAARHAEALEVGRVDPQRRRAASGASDGDLVTVRRRRRACGRLRPGGCRRRPWAPGARLAAPVST